MALRIVLGFSFGCEISHLGLGDLGLKPSGFVWFSQRDLDRVSRLECCGGLFAQRAIRSIEDKSPSNPSAELRRLIDQAESNLSRRFEKDLPRPLSVTDLSASPNDGTKVRISYKGVPGAYSEDAALKAYPRCETVPCDQFEDAFKVQYDIIRTGVSRV